MSLVLLYEYLSKFSSLKKKKRTEKKSTRGASVTKMEGHCVKPWAVQGRGREMVRHTNKLVGCSSSK